MRAIFISYRREDTEGHAGRLFEDLCDRFGKEAVFMDVAGIEPGRDFRRAIEQQVASCGVLLAVIGKDWLTVTDAQGRRRLDDPYDFVRLETANALKRDIPVIPVLVHQSVMPQAEQLPDDLKDLAFRNSVELTHARWSSDVQLLIKALLPYVDAAPVAPPVAGSGPVPPPAPGTTVQGARWALVPLTALVLGGGGYIAWNRLKPAPVATPVAAPVADDKVVAAASTPVSIAPPKASTASAAAADAPAASSPAKTRPVDKPAPVAARPPAVAPTLPASVSTPAPKPAPILAAAPAATPAPAPTTAASPAPSSLPEVVAGRSDPSLELLGSPGALSMVTRTIAIKPDTSFVNVTGGEVIRFDVGNKSFVWNFNGQRSSFNLAQVAPPSVLDRKVTAYVAPNPMYPRRN